MKLPLAFSTIALAGMLACGCASTPTPEPKQEPTLDPKPILTVAQLTDVHLRPQFEAPARCQAALRHLRQNHPEIAFVLNTGDTLDGANNHADTVAKWGFWKNATEELKGIPVHSLLGNHDMLAGPATDTLAGKEGACRMLGMPGRYYSFDQAGWHFIMLDGNGFAQDKEQWAWLVQELDQADANKTPVAILSHQPIFSMGAMVNSPGDHIGNWKGLVALFVKHSSVKLCLSGHTHLYDQSLYNGVTYVCGGSLAGYWWEKVKSSDGKGAYHETRPGYGILRLYADGQAKYDYVKYDK